ncbi:hypothetical protein IV55_GL001554 [Furfurilactobacillus siliginis]|nr:hypothetical protein IV55_GL001554 [Furfurilactobacillus siliginis]
MDCTIDLRKQEVLADALANWVYHDEYVMKLDTTLLIYPVTKGDQKVTLILDRHLGPFLSHQATSTLIKAVIERHWLTFQHMRIAHQFAGQHHYVPYVFGQYGFVPTAGPTGYQAGWLGFYHITSLQSFESDALLVFDNHLKLLLPMSHYFLHSRLVEAATIGELQKEYQASLIEYGGFNKQRPKLENKLAHTLHCWPEVQLKNPRELYSFGMEAMMTAAIETYLMEGYGDQLGLEVETLAADIRAFIAARGADIMPKNRHFPTAKKPADK